MFMGGFMEELSLDKKQLFTILKYKYEVTLSNNTLKYYSLIGMIEPSEIYWKKGHRGSISYYNQKTLKDIFLIRYCQKNTNWDLKKIKQFQDLSNFKDLKTLKEFSEYKIDVTTTEKGGVAFKITESFWDLTDFQEFMVFKAAIELDLLDINKRIAWRHYPDDQGTICIVKSDEGYSIIVNFPDPIKKRVIFKKTEIIIEEIK